MTKKFVDGTILFSSSEKVIMQATSKFNKRVYQNYHTFWKDFGTLFKKRNEIRTLMRGQIISKPFIERIMLTVTEVNGCRYCQYAHAKMALKSGLSAKEIDELANGVFHQCPNEEVPALLYAQHWAEMNGKPEHQTRQRVIAQYGDSVVEAIELAMSLIGMGNYLGNTWDYILFRASFGRLGK